MAVVVVGGHSRSIGKTSVVAGLISAMPERRWTAIKITQYGNEICSRDGHCCQCAPEGQAHGWAISEEADRSGRTDTSRFLIAGADRVLWVRTRQGFLTEAMPQLRRELAASANVIIESNSVLRFVRPDLYLMVLDQAVDDFKRSAREFLGLADALLVRAAKDRPDKNQFQTIHPPTRLPAAKPTFTITPSKYVTNEIVDFVRARLDQPQRVSVTLRKR
jgi:hypothetical protein